MMHTVRLPDRVRSTSKDCVPTSLGTMMADRHNEGVAGVLTDVLNAPHGQSETMSY